MLQLHVSPACPKGNPIADLRESVSLRSMYYCFFCFLVNSFLLGSASVISEDSWISRKSKKSMNKSETHVIQNWGVGGQVGHLYETLVSNISYLGWMVCRRGCATYFVPCACLKYFIKNLNFWTKQKNPTPIR